MKQSQLNKDFVFSHFEYSRYFHNDCSGGIERHYLGYMKNGHGKIVTKEETVVLSPGMLFYIPKGLRYHSYWNTTSETTRFSSLGFSYFPEEEENDYPLQIIPLPPENHITDTVLLLEQSNKITSERMARFFSLLAELLPQMTTSPAVSSRHLVNRAVALFQQRPHATAAEAAAYCGISETTLYALFRQTLCKTPVAIKQQILTEQAVALLTTTDLSVEEISNRLEFSSASYFRKIFEKHTGKTPREIRRSSSL